MPKVCPAYMDTMVA